MKVYIVLDCLDYEGCDIEAVFSTKKEAEKYIDGLEPIRGGQRREVAEWEVRGA